MDTTHCITNADWERYAAGTLEAKELHALQAHVALCELCSDIKEGIDAMAQPAMLKEKVAAINAEADKYLQRRKPRRLVVWYWSAAAAVIIAFGLGFWLLDRADDQITASGINKPAAVIEDTNDSVAETDTPVPLNNAQPAPLAKKPEAITAPVKKEELADIPAEQESAGIVEEQPSVENKAEFKVLKDELKKEQKKPVADIAPDFVLSDMPATARDTVQSLGEITLAKNKAATLPAPNYFNNNLNYTSGTTLNINGGAFNFSWYVSDSAEYKGAEMYYDSAKYDSCLVTIKRITESPASPYYEDALLLKARALMKQGKKKEARKVLKSVISLNGTRKPEAKKYLEELK